jgi:S-adenosylmethionine decarboxylase
MKFGSACSLGGFGSKPYPFCENRRWCSQNPDGVGKLDRRAEKEANRLHALGTHLLLELRDCNRTTLSNLEFVQETLKNAALEAKATIVEVAFHEFSPFGISGMVVIAESHLAIHTWPEYGYAAVDVFTCGDLIDPRVAAKFLIEKFQSKSPSIIEMKRGILGHEKLPHKVTVQGESLQHDRAEELQVVY